MSGKNISNWVFSFMWLRGIFCSKMFASFSQWAYHPRHCSKISLLLWPKIFQKFCSIIELIDDSIEAASLKYCYRTLLTFHPCIFIFTSENPLLNRQCPQRKTLWPASNFSSLPAGDKNLVFRLGYWKYLSELRVVDELACSVGELWYTILNRMLT